jgi:hypothetical protein
MKILSAEVILGHEKYGLGGGLGGHLWHVAPTILNPKKLFNNFSYSKHFCKN